MAAKVFICNSSSQADYKVWICDHQSEQKNERLIEDGRLVDHAGVADVKIYVVDYQSQADIKILKKNFPS